jgi:hypothetical protein
MTQLSGPEPTFAPLVAAPSSALAAARLEWLRTAFLGCVALIGAAPSFSYPFGRDQGLFAYVGQVWLEGGVPYRDIVDIKPPAVYALHAFIQSAIGSTQWGIRLVDALVVAACAWVASVGSARRVKIAVGASTHAAAVLLVSAWYYTTFDYWDTAQTESCEALCVLGAWLCAVEARERPRFAWSAGACLGLGFSFKFTALCFALPLAYTLWPADAGPRRLQQWALRLAAAAGGGTLVLAAWALYFWWRGALGDMLDVIIGLNSVYASGWATSWTESYYGVIYFLTGQAVPGTFLLAAYATWHALRNARSTQRNERAQALEGWLFWFAAFVAVAMQRKFFSYHWGILLVVMAFAAAPLAHAARQLPRVGALGMALGFAVLVWAFSSSWTTNAAVSYRSHASKWLGYVFGDVGRFDYADQFRGGYNYRYSTQEIVGLILEARKRPGDMVRVDGFEPAIYQVAGMRAPTRFAASHFLADPRLMYRRDEWLAQHARSLAENPPRFMVLQLPPRPLRFAGKDYAPIYALHNFSVFDRVDSTPMRF